jgi:glycosyltransferase involved in cell wall biosynthesis
MLAAWSLAQSRWKKLPYYYLRLRTLLHRAARIHATTVREATSNADFAGKLPTIVEPNGIDQCQFSPRPPVGQFRQQHGLDRQVPLTLFLGRIHPKKGLSLLLQAFAEVRYGKLVIAGPDNDGYATVLAQQARALRIDERVLFIGPVQGAQRLSILQDADVFVLPSHHENFGNTVIESLACGTPVIVSDQVDLCEELYGLGFAKVVRLEVQAIRQAIEVLQDQRCNPTMSAACREFAFARYEWRSIADRWRSHYETIITDYERR